MATSYIASKPELVSMKPKAETKAKEFEVEKVELSKNIQRFDRKPRVITKDPYAFNSISLRKNDNPTPSDLAVSPTHSQTAKMLGVDMVHDWEKSYDIVDKVVNLAKEKTGYTDPDRLINWLYRQANNAPSLSGSRLNDLHIYLKMAKEEKPKPKVITKKVYIKPKNTVNDFVNNLMNLKI